MCTHPFAKEALTLHLARSEGHERYFGCNLITQRKVLASSHQHLMTEAPFVARAECGHEARRVGAGNRQHRADRLDPILRSMVLNEADQHLPRRSSSAWAQYADALPKMSFARFSSRTSRSNSFKRSRSLVVRPGQWPASRWASRTHLAQRLGGNSSFGATDCTAALCLLFIHPPAHGSEVSPAARNTLDSARIPRASKLLICGLFLKGRVLAQDGGTSSASVKSCDGREVSHLRRRLLVGCS